MKHQLPLFTHTQCDAVRIHLWPTILPPQKCDPPCRLTCQGHEWFLAWIPPTIRGLIGGIWGRPHAEDVQFVKHKYLYINFWFMPLIKYLINSDIFFSILVGMNDGRLSIIVWNWQHFKRYSYSLKVSGWTGVVTCADVVNAMWNPLPTTLLSLSNVKYSMEPELVMSLDSSLPQRWSMRGEDIDGPSKIDKASYPQPVAFSTLKATKWRRIVWNGDRFYAEKHSKKMNQILLSGGFGRR